MERIISASYSSSFNLDVALRLCDHLDELPAPWFGRNFYASLSNSHPFHPIEHVLAVFIVQTLLPLGWWKSKQDMTSLG